MIAGSDTRAVAAGLGETAEAERSLRLMGTSVRVLVGAPARAEDDDPEVAADRVVAFLEDYDVRLSRFRAGSELSALNRDQRTSVPSSPLLRSAVGAALTAARRSGGLADPTLLTELEDAGYGDSWDPSRRIDLRAGLAAANCIRGPAGPRSPATWRVIDIDDQAGTITRPPGLRIDTGGSGKGHAADLAAALLDGYETWAVAVGGDVRVGGTAGRERAVEVEDPFGSGTLRIMSVREGAAATSGLRSRIWAGRGGGPRHHLLDPSTGEPAFTGLVAATALAPTALLAEALAKAAVLSGPAGAALFLAGHGGLTVDEHGHVNEVAAVSRPRVRVRLQAPLSAP